MTRWFISRRRALVPSLLIALPVLFLLVFFVVPTMFLLSVGFLESDGIGPVGGWTLDNFHTLLTRPIYYRAILRSFLVGTAVGALVIVLSYPLAYFLVRTTSRWRNLLIAVSLAPLLASVIVRTYGWWVVLNREGAINTLLKSIGVIDAPLVTDPFDAGDHHRAGACPAALRRADHHRLAERPQSQSRARGHEPGREPFRTFLSVTLPLTLPGIVGGFLLAFAIAISAYATPAILGGPATEVMATMIRTFMAVTLDWALGSAMGGILLVSAIGAAAPDRRAQRPENRRLMKQRSWPWVALTVVVGAIYVFIVGPILITTAVSFNATQPLVFPAAGLLAALVGGRCSRNGRNRCCSAWSSPRSRRWSRHRVRPAAGLRPAALRLPRQGRDPRRRDGAVDPADPRDRHRAAAVPDLVGLGQWIGFGALLIGHVVICLPFSIRTVAISLHTIPHNLEAAAGEPRRARRGPCCATSRCRCSCRASSPA